MPDTGERGSSLHYWTAHQDFELLVKHLAISGALFRYVFIPETSGSRPFVEGSITESSNHRL